jgi:hypothetical protein
MRNTDDIRPRAPAEFSPEWVLWCAQTHLNNLKRRHTAAMQEADILADEITRCEQHLAVLELGDVQA